MKYYLFVLCHRAKSRFLRYFLLYRYEFYRWFPFTYQVFGALESVVDIKTAATFSTADLWRGVQATALLYIAVPFTILMSCIATFIWGVFGVFYVLPGFMSLLYYIPTQNLTPDYLF